MSKLSKRQKALLEGKDLTRTHGPVEALEVSKTCATSIATAFPK